MVLDGLPSEHSRRAYERALSDFFMWHRDIAQLGYRNPDFLKPIPNKMLFIRQFGSKYALLISFDLYLF